MKDDPFLGAARLGEAVLVGFHPQGDTLTVAPTALPCDFPKNGYDEALKKP